MTERTLWYTSTRVLAGSLIVLTNALRAFAQPTISGGQPTPVRPSQNAPAQIPAAVAQSSPPADEGPIVLLVEGRLTLRVQNVRLAWILNRLTTQMKLVIQLQQGAGNELVTADLQGVPLDDALHQLLKKNDAFFFYGSDAAQDAAALQVVWVYPKGKAAGLQPVPPEEWASTRELEAAAVNDDPQIRMNAVTAVIDRLGDGAAMPIALHAMTSDPDEGVRSMALFAARAKGLAIPAEVLSGLLVADSSESVRFLALEGLARDANARFYAETGLADPSPKVRQKAREILKQLEAVERRKSAAPPAQPVKRPRN